MCAQYGRHYWAADGTDDDDDRRQGGWKWAAFMMFVAFGIDSKSDLDRFPSDFGSILEHGIPDRFIRVTQHHHPPTMKKKWKWIFLLPTPSSAFLTTLVLPSQQQLPRLYHMTETTTATTNRVVVVCNNNIRSSSSSSTCTGVDNDDDGIPSTPPTNVKRTRNKSKRLYSFHEARRIARGHGFDTYQEFMEYSCPGAYQIPKDAHVVWNAVSK